MATGAQFVDIRRNRLLGTDDFKARLLEYLQDGINKGHEKSFDGGAVYGTAHGVSAAGNDQFSITGSQDSTDGLGHILNAEDSGYVTGIQFENTNAIQYQVGLHYATIPDGIQVNPRTGLPEFVSQKETIGEGADPDSVVDNGTTLTFVVDSVAEAGVSNAGRQCLVYKKVPGPNASNETIAIEIATVFWSGGFNRITTAAQFGQDTASTDASDYYVVLLGPTVRRNSVLLDTDGYAFIGIITGSGAGNPPAVFDTTDQDIINASLSDLQDITSRNATTDKLKIDVKSFAGDVNDPQIAVRNPSGTIVFEVDGNGNMIVSGTTTQQDVVQVNSSETITDNLTAGDNDASDSHLIKGTWRHTNTAGGANHFKVDGATGRIGIGQDNPGGTAVEGFNENLGITANTRLTGDLRLVDSTTPEVQYRRNGTGINIGGLWRTLVYGTNGDFAIQENTAAGGDFTSNNEWLKADNGLDVWQVGQGKHWTPVADDTTDLGTSSAQWRDLWIDGQANIDNFSLSTTLGEGVKSDIYPDDNAGISDRDLGSSTRRWAEIHARTIFLDTTDGYGVGSNLTPVSDVSQSLGTATRRWLNLYVQNLNFAGDFLPQSDGTQDIGSSSFRWQQGYFGGATNAGNGIQVLDGSGLAADLSNNSLSVQTTTNINSGTRRGVHQHLYQTLSNPGSFPAIVGYYGKVEVTNAMTSGSVTSAVGLQLSADFDHQGGVINNAKAIEIVGTNKPNAGTITTWRGINLVQDLAVTTGDKIGVDIGPIINAGGTAYSLRTSTGLVEFGGDVYPSANNSFDLGSASDLWNSVHVYDHYVYRRHIQNITGTFGTTGMSVAITDNSASTTKAGAWSITKNGAGNGHGNTWNMVTAHSSGNINTWRGHSISMALSHSGTATMGETEADVLRIYASASQTAGDAFATMNLLHIADRTLLTSGSPNTFNDVTNLYGLRIDDVTGGDTANYAISTGAGRVEFGEAIKVGNSTVDQAGMIRWTGTVFEGHDGSSWELLGNDLAALGGDLIPDTDAAYDVGHPTTGRWLAGYFGGATAQGGIQINDGYTITDQLSSSALRVNRRTTTTNLGEWGGYFNMESSAVTPTTSTIYGLAAHATVNAAMTGGTMNSVRSFMTSASLDHAGGTVNNYYGIYVAAPSGAGTLAASSGIFIDANSKTTTGDKVGLDIGSVTNAGGINYSLRTGAGTAQIGGGILNITNSTYQIMVNGNNSEIRFEGSGNRLYWDRTANELLFDWGSVNAFTLNGTEMIWNRDLRPDVSLGQDIGTVSFRWDEVFVGNVDTFRTYTGATGGLINTFQTTLSTGAPGNTVLVDAAIFYNNAGDLGTNLDAIRGRVQVIGSGAGGARFAGVYGSVTGGATNNITNAYAFYAESGSGNINNNFGIYIDDQTVGAGSNYSLRTGTTSGQSFHVRHNLDVHQETPLAFNADAPWTTSWIDCGSAGGIFGTQGSFRTGISWNGYRRASDSFWKVRGVNGFTTTGQIYIGNDGIGFKWEDKGGTLAYATDPITIAIISDLGLYPGTTATYDLGTSSNRWRELYTSGIARLAGTTGMSTENGNVEAANSIVAVGSGNQAMMLVSRQAISAGASTSNSLISRSTENNQKYMEIFCVHDEAGGTPGGSLGFNFHIGPESAATNYMQLSSTALLTRHHNPQADSSYDLGTDATKWRYLYTDSIQTAVVHADSSVELDLRTPGGTSRLRVDDTSSRIFSGVNNGVLFGINTWAWQEGWWGGALLSKTLVEVPSTTTIISKSQQKGTLMRARVDTFFNGASWVPSLYATHFNASTVGGSNNTYTINLDIAVHANCSISCNFDMVASTASIRHVIARWLSTTQIEWDSYAASGTVNSIGDCFFIVDGRPNSTL